MIIEVELDPQDTSIDEATVSNWYVEEGEAVEQGDTLVEMIAGDVTFDVKAPAAGTVVDLWVNEEEVVKVGDTLLEIEVEEEMALGDDEEDDDEDEDEEE